MNKGIRYFNNQLMAVLVISILIMTALGSYLYTSINNHNDEIAMKTIASKAEEAAAYYSQNLWTEMRTLKNIGVLLSDSSPENQDENIERATSTIDNIFQSEPSVYIGIMDTDGKSIYGDFYSLKEVMLYPGFVNTLGGNSDISYLKTGALFISYSVLHNDNVHYILYEICSASYVKKNHNLDHINSIGNVSLMTRDGDLVLPFTSRHEGDTTFFNSKSVNEVFKKIRLNQKTNKVCIEKIETTRGDMFFYTAEVENTPFILAGAIERDIAIAELDVITWSVMSSYALFVLLVLVLSVFLIISSVKVRESEELRTAKQIAENASNAKGLFLANMSHEIRTPINAILGMDEMILRRTKDRKLIQYAYSIKSSANSLLSLVSDVLDFSRLEAGKLKLREEPYLVATMLTDIIVLIKDRADSKGLYFNINVNKEMPDKLIGDGTRVKQVMINLLTNAVKYTVTGGVNLDIDFIKVDENAIDLSVSVKDTGIGLKKEDIDKIFLAFERFDEKRNSTVEGTGLGMSIVKQILDAMDSKININSIYGVGSVFSFVVRQRVEDWEPIGDYEDTSEKVALAKESYKPGLYAPTARLLAVDDMEINLRVVSGLLEQTGIRIDTALSGKEALELIAKNVYDVMLIDHRMPQMDGLELLNRIRDDANNPNHDCVCIALTANATEGIRDMYINAGFNDYLEKPVSGSVLEETLHQYIPADKIEEYVEDDSTSDTPVVDVFEEVKADEESGTEELHDELRDELEGLKEKGVLDIDAGIEYAGNEEMYAETLRFFRDTIDEKSDEIESLYFAENIEDYTIKVHALKSSARLIGAKTLSENARLLEEAGKNGDLDYIRNNTYDVLTEYRSLKELFGKI